MAIIFPQGVEVFANVASCVAAAGSGGTNGTSNPAAGTPESWTVSTGSTSFPVANFGTGTFTGVSATPPGNYFYVTDPADTTHEIVLVYDNNSSGSPGTTWKVERGMNGTTVAHASGATWVQVVTPFTLQNIKQTPGAQTAVTVNSTTETVLATYTPTSAELITGTTWEAVAFGTFTTPTGTSGVRGIQFCLRWGGVSGTLLAYLATGSIASAPTLTANAPATTTTVAAGSTFDVNGSVTWLSSTTATANLNAWYTGASLTTTANNATTVNTATSGQGSSTAVTISGSGPLVLTCKLGSASSTVVATAPVIYREA